MKWLNKITSSLCDFLLIPFRELNPIWGLLWISGLTSILVLCSYKFFSDQQEIGSTKNQIKAYLLELRLFKDDSVQMGRSIWGLLLKNLRYLQLNLRPFICMALPIVFLMIHMDMRFGRRPLLPRESTLLKVCWTPHGDTNYARDIQIEATRGIKIDTPPVYTPSRREVSWRIQALSIGTHSIRIKSSDKVYAKRVIVSRQLLPVSDKSISEGFWNEVLHPGEPPLPADFLEAVEVVYPYRTIYFFSHMSLHWIILFFLFTLAIGFSLKGALGIQI